MGERFNDATFLRFPQCSKFDIFRSKWVDLLAININMAYNVGNNVNKCQFVGH